MGCAHLTYQFLETVLKEGGHRAVQVPLNPRKAVPLIRIYLLLIEHSLAGQRTGQDHRLLHMDIIVGGSVDQQELAIPQVVHVLGQVTLLVALVVVRHVGETQIAFRIRGILNERNKGDSLIFMALSKTFKDK